MLLGCLGTKAGPFERALPWICARTRKCSGLVCGAHVSTELQGTWSRQSRCWTGAESPLCETAPTSDRGGAFPGRALLKAGFLSVLLNFPFYWREAKRQNVLPCVRATSGSGKTAEDTGHQAERAHLCLWPGTARPLAHPHERSVLPGPGSTPGGGTQGRTEGTRLSSRFSILRPTGII